VSWEGLKWRVRQGCSLREPPEPSKARVFLGPWWLFVHLNLTEALEKAVLLTWLCFQNRELAGNVAESVTWPLNRGSLDRAVPLVGSCIVSVVEAATPFLIYENMLL